MLHSRCHNCRSRHTVNSSCRSRKLVRSSFRKSIRSSHRSHRSYRNRGSSKWEHGFRSSR